MYNYNRCNTINIMATFIMWIYSYTHSVREREKERERERERERETHTETERQREREICAHSSTHSSYELDCRSRTVGLIG